MEAKTQLSWDIHETTDKIYDVTDGTSAWDTQPLKNMITMGKAAWYFWCNDDKKMSYTNKYTLSIQLQICTLDQVFFTMMKLVFSPITYCSQILSTWNVDPLDEMERKLVGEICLRRKKLQQPGYKAEKVNKRWQLMVGKW